MKGILVLLDGIGDVGCNALAGKTPLDAAETPNLDFFAARSELGLMNSVKPGFIPESDEAIVSLFGNELISSTRGQLEARGADIKLVRGDLALRANFATIDSYKEGNIIDRRCGRTLTTDEANVLANALNKQIKMPCKFLFKPTIQHRGSLIFRGGFSDMISGNDYTYFQGKARISGKIGKCKSLDDEENSQYTSNIVNEFLERAYEILNNHPINQERRKKGLLPANFLLVRGAGTEIPKLKQYKNWASVAYMPLEIGFSKICGMEVYDFDYPKMKAFDVYENLYDGLRMACGFSIKTIEKTYKKFDYLYIHIKETDMPGHDNKPLEKKAMIEYIDKTLFNFLREFVPMNKIKVVITGDHSTPCKLKSHSTDPVPVLYYNPQTEIIPKENRFNEESCKNGSLGKFDGKELLKKVGFVK